MSHKGRQCRVSADYVLDISAARREKNIFQHHVWIHIFKSIFYFQKAQNVVYSHIISYSPLSVHVKSSWQPEKNFSTSIGS